MRSSLLDELNTLVKSSYSSKSDSNLQREYEKRIRLLEEENARITAHKLSDDLIDLLSTHDITLEHIVVRLKEVTKDQLLREKESTIKALLQQVAYYKEQRRMSLLNENLTPQKPSKEPFEEKSAIHLALEKAQSERKEKSVAIDHLKSRLTATEQLNKQLEQEVEGLKKKIAALQHRETDHEITLEKLKAEHSINIKQAMMEAEQALNIQAKTMEETESTKILKIRKAHETELAKVKAENEERLKAQREQFEAKIKELEQTFSTKLSKSQKEYRRELQTIKKTNVGEGSEEITRLREQLETIQKQYGDVTEKSAKIIQMKVSELQKEREAAMSQLKVEHEKEQEAQNEHIAKLKESFQQSIRTMEEEISVKVGKIGEHEKSIVDLRQKNSLLREELEAANYKYELMEKECETTRRKARKLEQILSEIKDRIISQAGEIQELNKNKEEMNKELEVSVKNVQKYKKALSKTLNLLAKMKGEVIRLGILKNDLNEIKFEFTALKSYVAQRICMLPKLLPHIKPPPKAEAAFDKALTDVKETLDQVCVTLRSHTTNAEMLKSVLESSAKKKVPQTPPVVHDFAVCTTPREIRYSLATEPLEKPLKFRRLSDKLMAIRSALQSIKIAAKDFALRIHETMLNTVTSIGHAHYGHLLTLKRRYKAEKDREKREEKERYENKIKEKEIVISKLKDKLTGLQAENTTIQEKMAEAEQEAIKIDRLLKEKKGEKVEFKKELTGILSQMKDIKQIVRGECKTLRSTYEGKVQEVKKVLQPQSIPSLKNVSNF